MSIPSQERLASDLGRAYKISDAQGNFVHAELRRLREAPAMSRRHACYAALLALPESLRLAQGVYAVASGDDEWALLLTPVGPDEDGRQLMESLFHIEIPS